MAYKKRKRKFDNKMGNKGNLNKKTQKFFDDYKEYEGDKETNDPSWYAQYPELMIDSASLPYSIPTGTEIKWDISIPSGDTVVADGAYNVFESVPGILTLGIVPTPGLSSDATSPVNVAADMLYTKVRAENSGARNYDSPDLLLYCLAMDQVYSLITWYNRIYGTIMLYSQVNRYLPKALLESQWIDADDMLLHINDFKAFIDTATAQAAVFSVPSDMKLFNRHAFMYQNIYKDAESPKSQLYQFVPRGFYAYNEVNGPGELDAVNVIAAYPNKMKFSDLVHLFHTLMDPIIASEDFNIMSGDILKAFGEGNLLKLQIMPQGYTILPVADYEVLTQIKNATLSNLATHANLGFGSRADWNITQDANADFIVWNPAIVSNSTPRNCYSRDRYLSTYKTQPTPADNMVATRLMYAVGEVDESTGGTPTYVTYFDAVGSEFVIAAVITMFMHDSQGDWKTNTYAIQTLSENNAGLGGTTAVARLFLLCKHFDFCPALYMFGSVSGTTYFFPIFDLDNWTIVHAYELEKMHRTALMSMLRVPMIGSALPSSLRVK